MNENLLPDNLQVTLYSIGAGVIIINAAGCVTLMNPVASSFTGWSEAEALGKHLNEIFVIVDEKVGSAAENPAICALRAGKTIEFASDMQLVAREGSLHHIGGSAAPVLDETGTAIGVVLVFYDQTREQAMRDKLVVSEEKFRTFFDKASDGILIVNVITRKFVHGNAAICSMLGYTKKEMECLSLTDIHPSQDILRVLNAFEKQEKGESALARDLPVLRKDGTIFYADISAVPVIIGEMRCVLGIFRDITDRKQAEEERRAHIHFLESLERINQAIKQEDSVDKMLRSTLETVFSLFDCDRVWLFYPCDPDAPTFRVPMEIYRPEYPGAKVLNVDVPMSPGMAGNLREALASDGPVVYIAGTEKSVNKDSAEIFGVKSQMFVALYPRSGKPWVFGMHQCSYPRIWTSEEKKLFNEISRRISDGLSSVLFLRELQENEERFRATFEQAAVGIIHSSPDGRLLRVNQKLCDITGYSREDFLNKTFQELTYPEDLAASMEYVHQVLMNEIRPHSIEKRCICKDGSLVWVNLTISIVRSTSDDPAYLIGVVEDITKRRKAEEEREELQVQLLQSQKIESVGRLAGGVAHDFNNMLSVILGHAELALNRAGPTEQIQVHLKEITKAGRRAADLTRQLLAFARKQPASPKVLELNEMVNKTLSMLRRLLGEDIDLVWLPGSELWLVKIDPTQADQILVNLCVNARDAIAEAGKIIIETRNVFFDEAYCNIHTDFLPGEYVQLAVSDNGCGMTREVLQNIFEPFFTTKTMGKGTGLGLSTVYGIVKQNLGFINVYSEPTAGTTFRIYFPRHMGSKERAPATDLIQEAAGGQTILLVEDELTLLDLGRAMLEKLGYRVLTANTPGKAIELAKKFPGEIDLLLTDVIMPEMNGHELCKRLLLLCPDLKFLFMSGYTANVIAHHGVLDEDVCFIQKPFSQEDLSLKICEALQRR